MRTADGELRMEVAMIDIPTMGGGPSKSWRYTDDQGHEHYYDGHPDPYPTLMNVVDETYYCHDCEDEHTDSHLECRICGERIEPAMSAGSAFVESIPGRVSYYLDDRPITPDEYAAVLNAHQSRQVK